jgi:hypothetical protein
MSITAMKQALEALEYLLTYTKDQDDEKIAWDAITALRQAIEQAEKPREKYPECWATHGGLWIEALYKHNKEEKNT